MSGLVLALAIAQAASPAPARLSSVEIRHPYGEQERFARYVEIRAGESYDPAAIRRAVRLLYATGEIADVRVEATDAGDERALVFYLVPAPRLAAIRVEGSTELSKERVEEATDLRDGEPLWRERLDRAARDLALELVRDGYLEARVDADVESDATGATAVFRVTTGPQVRVATITVRAPGLDPFPTRVVTERARPRRGEVFRRAVAEKAAEQMRQLLAEMGHWRATVGFRESYDPARARVSLEFEVQNGPRTRIAFAGGEPPASIRRRVEEILSEGGAQGDALAETVDVIEEHYRERGHRSVLVTPTEETEPQGLRIVYEIDAGPETRVASTTVVGEQAEQLLPLVPAELRSGGGPIRDEEIAQAEERLRRELHRLGYPEAHVTAEIPDGPGRVPVVLRVAPGPRTVLRSVTVTGASTEVASPELPLRAGEPYRTRDVAMARDALLGAYRDAGFLEVRVDPEVSAPEPGQAAVALRIEPGPRTSIDQIVIAGLELTREEVVRRELLFEEGAPLSPRRLLESQRRLSALGIFSQVDIRELDPEAPNRRSLVVEVVEAPRTVLSYGAGYSERDLARANVELTRRNLFGGARSVTAFARIGFRGSRFLVTFREPYLLGLRRELFLTFFREEEDREGFDFERFGGLVQTARNLSAGSSLIARYSFRRTRSFNIQEGIEVDREFQNATFSGPSVSLILDSRDDPLDPRGGLFLGADAQLSVSALGGDPYFKSFVQLAVYRALHHRVLIALAGRVGLAATYGSGAPDQLPLPERFFAGGAYSLRGFPVDQVDPAGGNALILGSAELRVPVVGALSLGVFTDVGNTFGTVEAIELGELRYAAGVGVRYNSPFGPLRVDWAHKLNRREGESRYRFHFAIGHAF
jgi:outer membrane protein insertion porin family